ncbi:MAG: ABC transporter permease [Actinomycetota bacterium]
MSDAEVHARPRSDVWLTLNQLRYTNKAFWRNPATAFFTFAFPLMFLVIFTVLFGNDTIDLSPGQTVNTSTFYVASITAFSVITACYTNLAIGVSFLRDQGVLKRTRGTPQPGWTYLAARILHSVLVSLLLVVICVTFGALFYDVTVPTTTLPAFLVTLVIGAASFCALGLALTAVIPNADASPAIVNASILPLLFISDVFIPLREDAPKWLSFLADLFPVKHFVEGMLASFFPLPGESSFRPGDLLIMAVWGLAGLLLAIRFFSWEPRR